MNRARPLPLRPNPGRPRSWYKGNRVSSLGDTLHISIGITDRKASNNRVVTSKYTIWNFLPLNLFSQFRRIANFYFLMATIIVACIDSPVSPWTSLLPLLFVISVTACKQAYEDFHRHCADNEVNTTMVSVIRNGVSQELESQSIQVGDLVRVERDQDVPCDIVILASSHPNGRCYVTTANLDGETNLKTVLLPVPVRYVRTTDHLKTVQGAIECESPNPDLYRFHGRLELTKSVLVAHPTDSPRTSVDMAARFRRPGSVVEQEEVHTELSVPLTAENLVLKGSRLRNTDYVYGCAVYTGQKTKLALNSVIKKSKVSTVEGIINTYLSSALVMVLALSLTCTLAKNIRQWRLDHVVAVFFDTHLGDPEEITIQSILEDLLSFALLFNYLIPISLYVTIEMQKFLGAYFFTWDNQIYDPDTNRPALCNTTDLNEELGLVEYLFCDKTGTLTENVMVFRRCCINGAPYAERSGKLYALPLDGDHRNSTLVNDFTPGMEHFFLALALCHTVQMEYEEAYDQLDGSHFLYQSSSPDERALLLASARCGIVFLGESEDYYVVRVRGEVMAYRRLETLEFTSERKRMSVLVRDPAGQDWVFCKGAETTILPLIKLGKKNKTMICVDDFAMRGLRTMLVACRRLDEGEFRRAARVLRSARGNMTGDRESLLDEACSLLERDLTLLGATALEDRLQTGVPDTLAGIRAAGIRTWILTGDKVETAVSISFTTSHFHHGLEVLFLTDHTSTRTVNRRLNAFVDRITSSQNEEFGLVVDGKSLGIALDDSPELFRQVGQLSAAVVCCRLTPLQKSRVVRLIKRSSKRPVTAAIGDGANDVSMIQEAHIGIGIMGKEGRQAERSADFALGRFRFLQRAFLVHGHWYYVRIVTLVQYFFYKNVVFVLPQFYFQMWSKFSKQSLYESIFLACFNIVFTSVPILVYGLLEQDRPAYQLLQYPYLYKMHTRNRLMGFRYFLEWMLLGIWHSMVVYFVPVLALHFSTLQMSDGTEFDISCVSTVIYSSAVLVVNVKLFLVSHFWTVPLWISVVMSLIPLFIVNMIYGLMASDWSQDRFWLYMNLLGAPVFWIIIVLTLSIALLPDTTILVITTTAKSQKDPDLKMASKMMWCCCKRRTHTWPVNLSTEFNRQSGRVSLLRQRECTVFNDNPQNESKLTPAGRNVTSGQLSLNNVFESLA